MGRSLFESRTCLGRVGTNSLCFLPNYLSGRSSTIFRVNRYVIPHIRTPPSFRLVCEPPVSTRVGMDRKSLKIIANLHLKDYSSPVRRASHLGLN